jgi:FkbM family methyltransferase
MNYYLANYYCSKYQEFMGENCQEKLIEGLKKFTVDNNTNKKILGIDVGANLGNTIYLFNDIFKTNNIDILLFEPNPVNIKILKEKIKDNGNIHLYENAVSNENTKTSFYNWRDSVLNEAGNPIGGLRAGGNKICDVDVVRLDHILKNYDIDNIEIKLLKIDTEGNDTNVIKGLGKYLKCVKYLIFECSDCLDDHRGPGIPNPMKNIVDYLDVNGFNTYRIGIKKCFRVNGEYWNDIYERKFWSDCFSCKKDDPINELLVDKKFDYTF